MHLKAFDRSSDENEDEDEDCLARKFRSSVFQEPASIFFKRVIGSICDNIQNSKSSSLARADIAKNNSGIVGRFAVQLYCSPYVRSSSGISSAAQEAQRGRSSQLILETSEPRTSIFKSIRTIPNRTTPIAMGKGTTVEFPTLHTHH